ncbi:hypothetical protein CONLIGDRAFT_141361 [Coniochaeta ligniaria NRRL 30616]|uniref:Uncharacterized protein n=1 Tax=Coniochaeta ligniaria NRRL 30616 TaxID=1408157 RepID=A0A1J7J883_9PEZI|nr:hypothetical protein CONLIGDRAFT_141361 [Coniochaeta ligniaria NRRL 30616]
MGREAVATMRAGDAEIEMEDELPSTVTHGAPGLRDAQQGADGFPIPPDVQHAVPGLFETSDLGVPSTRQSHHFQFLNRIAPPSTSRLSDHLTRGAASPTFEWGNGHPLRSSGQVSRGGSPGTVPRRRFWLSGGQQNRTPAAHRPTASSVSPRPCLTWLITISTKVPKRKTR